MEASVERRGGREEKGGVEKVEIYDQLGTEIGRKRGTMKGIYRSGRGRRGKLRSSEDRLRWREGETETE